MKNNKQIIRSWCMYDWANSVYNLVINTSIFPIYYSAITANEQTGDRVSFFGYEIVNSVLYSYAFSFSYLLSASILPLLSGIADYTGRKLTFLKIFTFLGAFSCMGMFLFTKGNIEWGIFCVIFASLGYSSSLVFYDAYLPEIATPESTDRISARGYAYGYLGSAILLILSLILITYHQTFGFADSGQATRVVFLLVGIWWIGFAQIPFRNLPVNVFHKKPKGKILLNGYREIRKVFFKLQELSPMKKYILAFLFFNMGVQTVMLLATLFGSKVLQLEAGQLIPILLIIQFVGIAGSILFARLSERHGNIFSLTVMLIIWIGICLTAYFISSVTQFYVLAVVVGLVMGGIQALSRATFSKLIPEKSEDHASFFSFYDVTYHISVVLGTFSYGLIEQVTGSMRNSSLVLGVFFLIGLTLLRFVKLSPYGKA